ncbi:MAG: hypothetical protein QXM75_01285 [Candidatus Diapherotrites archaeon]
MKISISKKSEIEKIPKNLDELHLVRPLSMKTLSEFIKEQKNLIRISLSQSTYDRLSLRAKKFLTESGIDLEVVSARGRPLEIPLTKMKQAVEMRRDHRPLREIEQVTGIPKSTIHYLEKYSKRKKIKKGSMIIYLGKASPTKKDGLKSNF